MSSRHLQDVFARSLPKTSSRRLRKTSKTSLKRLRKTSSPDIFATRLPKTSSRRFQDFCKTPSRRVSNTSSRRLQEDLLQLGLEDALGDKKCYTEDVFQTCLQDIFKTSSKRPFAIMSWRRLGRQEMLHWRRLQYVSTKTNVCWEYKTNTFFFNKIIPSLWKYNNFFLFAKVILCFFLEFKASLTLNDLCDTICMTHNSQSVFRFSFHCVYTFIQVVHTKFIKVVCTEYSAFKNFSKMS